MGKLKRVLLGISPEEVRLDRRGFACRSGEVRERIEQIGLAFLEGYHAALLDPQAERLAERLERVELELRGFAYEGAAMGLALSDFFTLKPSYWQAFLQGPGAKHLYMLHVGVGWAWARLPFARARFWPRLDSLLRWLAIDGLGFHQGYFRWQRFIAKRELPDLAGYKLCAFDQGLGRSLWFVEGADPERIAHTIACFPKTRRADLWSGVGLACAYAGGVGPRAYLALRELAGSYLPQLAQGAAFAAKARQRAGNLAHHTEQACRILCGLTAEQAAALTDAALADLPTEELAYERWRRRIQAYFGWEEDYAMV
jgi:hypothetical protein